MSQEMEDDDPYEIPSFHRGSAENSEEVWNERDLYCEPIRMFPADVSLTDCPLAVFSEIWEMSYEENGDGKKWCCLEYFNRYGCQKVF